MVDMWPRIANQNIPSGIWLVKDRHITPNQSTSFGGLISIVGKNKFPVETGSYQDPPFLLLRDWQKWKLIREKQPREEEEIKSYVNIWTWMCFPLNKPMHYLEFLYIFPLRISFLLLNMYCSLDCLITPKMKHIS